jgi:uncharacterized protein DUF4214
MIARQTRARRGPSTRVVSAGLAALVLVLLLATFLSGSGGSSAPAGAAANRDYVEAALTSLEGRRPAASVIASLTRSPTINRAAIVAAAMRGPAVAAARVERTYADLLRRNPTASELAVWTTRLRDGDTRLSLVAALAQSGGYARAAGGGQPASLVAAWSRDLAGGALDSATRRALTASLSRGASRGRVVAEILASAPARRAVVARAYLDVLRRPVDPGGLTTYTRYLASGHSEEQLLLVLLGSPEFARLALKGAR